MPLLPHQKLISLLLSGLLLAHPLMADLSQSSIWEERSKHTQMASLPLPSVHPTLPTFSKTNPPSLNKYKHVSSRLKSLINLIPVSSARIEEVYEGPRNTNQTIVLIQDVHLNSEAQVNIASILQSLIDHGHISVVGVEGAFDPFDFSNFRSFEDKLILKKVAKAFMDKSFMAAPSYVALTSDKDIPLFQGVDNKEHHTANVEAYLKSQDTRDKIKKDLQVLSTKYQALKENTFNPALLQFDQYKTAYQKDQLGLGSYINTLSNYPANFGLHLSQFQEAYNIEQSLNFDRVENERQRVIEKLSKKVDQKQMQALLDHSLAYRMGKLSFGDYYSTVKDLCDANGVNFKSTPEFERYVQYVLLADGLDSSLVIQELEQAENDIVDVLAQTGEEQDLIRQSDHLALVQKLIEFKLTPREWEKYASAQFSVFSSQFSKLSVFEDFYTEAHKRSNLIIENLLKTENRKLKISLSRVLVVGGFHTPDITSILKKKQYSYIVVSPKISRLRQGYGGQGQDTYLSIFDRDKTPLEQLFAGKTLFINSPDVNLIKGERLESHTWGTLARHKSPQKVAAITGTAVTAAGLFVAANMMSGYRLVEPLMLDAFKHELGPEFGGVIMAKVPVFNFIPAVSFWITGSVTVLAITTVIFVGIFLANQKKERILNVIEPDKIGLVLSRASRRISWKNLTDVMNIEFNKLTDKQKKVLDYVPHEFIGNAINADRNKNYPTITFGIRPKDPETYVLSITNEGEIDPSLFTYENLMAVAEAIGDLKSRDSKVNLTPFPDFVHLRTKIDSSIATIKDVAKSIEGGRQLSTDEIFDLIELPFFTLNLYGFYSQHFYHANRPLRDMSGPLYQNKNNFGGMGIGLYLSKKVLVEAGFGYERKSEKGKTTFSILMPKESVGELTQKPQRLRTRFITIPSELPLAIFLAVILGNNFARKLFNDLYQFIIQINIQGLAGLIAAITVYIVLSEFSKRYPNQITPEEELNVPKEGISIQGDPVNPQASVDGIKATYLTRGTQNHIFEYESEGEVRILRISRKNYSEWGIDSDSQINNWKLVHQLNLLHVYRYGYTLEGHFFVICEKVSGESLEDIIDSGRFTSEYQEQLLNFIKYLIDNNIHFNDITNPGNIRFGIDESGDKRVYPVDAELFGKSDLPKSALANIYVDQIYTLFYKKQIQAQDLINEIKAYRGQKSPAQSIITKTLWDSLPNYKNWKTLKREVLFTVLFEALAIMATTWLLLTSGSVDHDLFLRALISLVMALAIFSISHTRKDIPPVQRYLIPGLFFVAYAFLTVQLAAEGWHNLFTWAAILLLMTFHYMNDYQFLSDQKEPKPNLSPISPLLGEEIMEGRFVLNDTIYKLIAALTTYHVSKLEERKDNLVNLIKINPAGLNVIESINESEIHAYADIIHAFIGRVISLDEVKTFLSHIFKRGNILYSVGIQSHLAENPITVKFLESYITIQHEEFHREWKRREDEEDQEITFLKDTFSLLLKIAEDSPPSELITSHNQFSNFKEQFEIMVKFYRNMNAEEFWNQLLDVLNRPPEELAPDIFNEFEKYRSADFIAVAVMELFHLGTSNSSTIDQIKSAGKSVKRIDTPLSQNAAQIVKLIQQKEFTSLHQIPSASYDGIVDFFLPSIEGGEEQKSIDIVNEWFDEFIRPYLSEDNLIPFDRLRTALNEIYFSSDILAIPKNVSNRYDFTDAEYQKALKRLQIVKLEEKYGDINFWIADSSLGLFSINRLRRNVRWLREAPLPIRFDLTLYAAQSLLYHVSFEAHHSDSDVYTDYEILDGLVFSLLDDYFLLNRGDLNFLNQEMDRPKSEAPRNKFSRKIFFIWVLTKVFQSKAHPDRNPVNKSIIENYYFDFLLRLSERYNKDILVGLISVMGQINWEMDYAVHPPWKINSPHPRELRQHGYNHELELEELNFLQPFMYRLNLSQPPSHTNYHDNTFEFLAQANRLFQKNNLPSSQNFYRRDRIRSMLTQALEGDEGFLDDPETIHFLSQLKREELEQPEFQRLIPTLTSMFPHVQLLSMAAGLLLIKNGWIPALAFFILVLIFDQHFRQQVRLALVEGPIPQGITLLFAKKEGQNPEDNTLGKRIISPSPKYIKKIKNPPPPKSLKKPDEKQSWRKAVNELTSLIHNPGSLKFMSIFRLKERMSSQRGSFVLTDAHILKLFKAMDLVNKPGTQFEKVYALPRLGKEPENRPSHWEKKKAKNGKGNGKGASSSILYLLAFKVLPERIVKNYYSWIVVLGYVSIGLEWWGLTSLLLSDGYMIAKILVLFLFFIVHFALRYNNPNLNRGSPWYGVMSDVLVVSFYILTPPLFSLAVHLSIDSFWFLFDTYKHKPVTMKWLIIILGLLVSIVDEGAKFPPVEKESVGTMGRVDPNTPSRPQSPKELIDTFLIVHAGDPQANKLADEFMEAAQSRDALLQFFAKRSFKNKTTETAESLVSAAPSGHLFMVNDKLLWSLISLNTDAEGRMLPLVLNGKDRINLAFVNVNNTKFDYLNLEVAIHELFHVVYYPINGFNNSLDLKLHEGFVEHLTKITLAHFFDTDDSKVYVDSLNRYVAYYNRTDRKYYHVPNIGISDWIKENYHTFSPYQINMQAITALIEMFGEKWVWALNEKRSYQDLYDRLLDPRKWNEARINYRYFVVQLRVLISNLSLLMASSTQHLDENEIRLIKFIREVRTILRKTHTTIFDQLTLIKQKLTPLSIAFIPLVIIGAVPAVSVMGTLVQITLAWWIIVAVIGITTKLFSTPLAKEADKMIDFFEAFYSGDVQIAMNNLNLSDAIGLDGKRIERWMDLVQDPDKGPQFMKVVQNRLKKRNSSLTWGEGSQTQVGSYSRAILAFDEESTSTIMKAMIQAGVHKKFVIHVPSKQNISEWVAQLESLGLDVWLLDSTDVSIFDLEGHVGDLENDLVVYSDSYRDVFSDLNKAFSIESFLPDVVPINQENILRILRQVLIAA